MKERLRMSTFDDREKGFERKYVLDEEQTFKASVRRNKLLGLWAAEKLGKSGDAANAYAQEVIDSDFEHHGDDDVVGKVMADFKKAGVALSEKELRAEMERLLVLARQQIASAGH